MLPEENKTPAEPAKKLESAIARSRLEKAQEGVKPLRTYQSDVADTIKKDNVSVIKMALAEKKRQEAQGLTAEAQSSDKKKSILYLSLSGVLILAGLLVIGYFLFTRFSGPAFVISLPQNLIYAEKTTEVKLDRADAELLASDVNGAKEAKRPALAIENLVVTEKDTGADLNRQLGARHAISGPRLITLLGSDIPDPLFRSIQNPYMLGVYQESSGPKLFLILKTDSYETAFAGMLEWERTMGRDMARLFSLPENTRLFTDRIISNRDTRILVDDSGQVIFLYSFLNPNTILMAQDEETFKEILVRELKAEHQK